MASTASALLHKQIAGGSFLLEERAPEEVFTPEDFTDEQRQIARTTEEFVTNEVLPFVDRLERKDWELIRELIRKAGELGLIAADIPEQYGGMGMDKISSTIISDFIAKYGSFCAAFGAQPGIGSLPMLYFGTEQQKQKYLPKVAAGECLCALALSESSSGSDAMSIRTRAVLSADGKHYVLNGEKLWVTNAAFADLFIVFAKVDGEKFTAFIVERNTSGLSIGAEEHKMGLRGSSTCPLVFNDCQVPVENLLGEVGKGHLIGFNILNIGRFKIGAGCVGGARTSLQNAIAYAKQRKAFGKFIAEFGLIREKLARMAAWLYAVESMVYRTVGMVSPALSAIDESAPEAAKDRGKALAEYLVECSIVKVAATEMVSFVVDEAVQIHGGYGFVEEYPAERAYRDARVNRIFEGTSEINRLIIPRWLLKRAQAGQLPLLPAIQQLLGEVADGHGAAAPLAGPLAAERALTQQAKKATLFAIGVASRKYPQTLNDEQEIVAALADMIIEVFALDSSVIRARKIVAAQGEAAAVPATAMAQIYAMEAMIRLEAAARKIVGAVSEGDTLGAHMMTLRRLFKYDPVNVIALQQKIAQHVLDRGKYKVA